MTQDQKNQKLAEHFQMCPLFDHFTSLDAVHELEMKLSVELKTDYIRLLNKGDFSYRRLAFATAAQRAEALGITLGLWKEGE